MTFATVSIIVFFGALGQAVFGFGGGLIAIPLLSLVIGVQDAVTLALVLQLATAFLLLRHQEEIKWRDLKFVTTGLFLGTGLGTYFLSSVHEDFLRLFLASFIAAYLIQSRFLPISSSPVLRTWAGAMTMGTAAGFLQGLIGTGGPPLVIYLRETLSHKSPVRAGMLFLLFASNIVRMPLSFSLGLFNPYVNTTVIASIPCFLLAMFVGDRLHGKMSERQYRTAIDLILAVSAISLFLNSLAASQGEP